ncbi:Peroxidase [Bertholletia excelsa]
MNCLGLIWLFVIGFSVLDIGAIEDGLEYNYYRKSCPQAEEIIADMMANFTSADQRVAARMLRMLFHDCFVRGCDGSILLNSTPENKAEKDALPNNPSVKAFELIDQIKEVLENKCPGVVSCADILSFAARECSSGKAGKFDRYQLRGGRKDGRISQESDALLHLPPPSANVQLLIQSFAKKGLSIEDLVALSGGHSIGVSHCSSLLGRHVNFSKTGTPYPSLDFHLAKKLRSECDGDGITPTKLDHKYYMGLLQNKGLFTSDQSLVTNTLTRKQVMANAVYPLTWRKKFVDAMVKMAIKVLILLLFSAVSVLC